MNSISSFPVPTYPTEYSDERALPNEMIAMIISKLDKADVQTLSHIAQTCKDLWHLTRPDMLRSFFYVAQQVYEAGDSEKKVAVFRTLADWIVTVAAQLPEPTRWQIIGHLSYMATIDDIAASRLEAMARSIVKVSALAKQEALANLEILTLHLDQATDPATANRVAQIKKDCVELNDIALRLVAAYLHYSNSFIDESNVQRQRK